MPLYIFARFEPKAGKQRQLLDELKLLVEPTRGEPGCVRIHLYQSVCEPLTYFVHSEWADDDAFEVHVRMPHVARFAGLAEDLMTNPFQAMRTQQIG